MAAAPPVIPDDLVEEILLRLPPDDPAFLLRASIVCKDWGGIVSRPAFRRRLHELHRAPPVLGFLRDRTINRLPHFIPTTASSFSPAAPDWHRWRAQDCRHGRALFFSFSTGKGTLELLVWEPTTGAQQRVPVPAAFGSRDDYPMAAVLCAADGCDHRDCLGGPFRVVFSFDVFIDPEEEEWVRSACVYSSETGTWGELTSVHSEFLINYQRYSSMLVGSSLLYFRGRPEHTSITSIMEYDMARNALTVFEPPGNCSERGFNLMLTEDGGLGVIEKLFNRHIKLWTWKAIGDTEARWVLSREICLDNLLPIDARSDARYGGAHVVRFVEGANIFLVRTVAGLFTIELQSEQVRKVCNYHGSSDLIPVVGFYTPVPRGEHQNLLALKPSEEAGGGEEKTLDQAQLLFVNTFESISHGHNMRVPRYEEVALEGASTLNIYGCTLLPKAAPNEESVMGTSRKDDAGNSTTSGSNVVCAPPSEKGDS